MATLARPRSQPAAARPAPDHAKDPGTPPPGNPPGQRLPRLRHLGPNWYAMVMGTAIVATAGAGIPFDLPGLRAGSIAVWALSAVALVVLLIARTGHWRYHSDQARAHLHDPAMAPFYGCVAMALLAVGAATLAVGREVLGQGAAVVVDAVLFGAGTLLGLLVAVAMLYLLVVRHRPGPAEISPVWLLPVVPPMVSAAAGPSLLPYLPAGQGREALLFGCYGLFGLSLLASLTLLPLIFGRLVHHGPLPLALTPSLFLVLGPLGQSTTAASRLADVAHGAVSAPYARALGGFAVLYGVPVMGFALLWLALATALVVRAWRRGMRFTMAWWAFTFPVGTCVTGAEGLAGRTGLVALEWLALGLYALLVTAWAVAAWCTLRGLLAGVLPAASPAPAPATVRTT
ncbi:TDT family transporter [Streptomyces sp. GMY02]|uniref:TDT family transporter n=1 Tax=Streptomyces sp. GMY02 TaxID=1333528 RepID=UPI001C2BE626|nr:TDT family transporter [Streptomyces sp. GMY02]QXE37749.1 TDT family transporter [Streptomyces sp. GMY02]